MVNSRQLEAVLDSCKYISAGCGVIVTFTYGVDIVAKTIVLIKQVIIYYQDAFAGMVGHLVMVYGRKLRLSGAGLNSKRKNRFNS